MAIVVKAKPNDNTNDLIKRFKKVVVSSDIVQKVKDRQYYQRPSQMKKMAGNENRRLRRRLRGLKKMKNIPPEVIVRMTDKLSSVAK